MKTAIVHPWYLSSGGAEQTVNALAGIFPKADFFTLLYRPQDLPQNLKGRNISALGMNWIPGKYHFYRYLLPFYPLMVESLDLRGYDLVISSDSCVTKGVILDQGAAHVCYCHSPMRCLWDQRYEYLHRLPMLARPAFTLGTHYVRQWDISAASRVNTFVANSQNVAERIRSFYGRESTLIYPPVDTAGGYLADSRDDFYLTTGRLAEVKRIDLLIQACNRLKRRLVIAGGGREERRLKALAGPTISFVGRVPDSELSRLYATCRAFLFAADEDFGIVPVEAQSYGRPVIAYGKGGVLETVIAGAGVPPGQATGVFFENQTAESIEGAILRFEKSEGTFIPSNIQRHAKTFDARIFAEKIQDVVNDTLNRRQLGISAGEDVLRFASSRV